MFPWQPVAKAPLNSAISRCIPLISASVTPGGCRTGRQGSANAT